MFDDSIDVLTYPTVLDRNRPVPNYDATPVSVTITGVDAQPGASTELLALQRSGVAVRWTVYVPYERIPYGVTLNARSIVRIGTDIYQVDGQPAKWSGSLGHLVLSLTDWSVQ